MTAYFWTADKHRIRMSAARRHLSVSHAILKVGLPFAAGTPSHTQQLTFELFCAAPMSRTALLLMPGGCGRGCEAVRVHVCARLQNALVHQARGVLRREAARGKGRRGNVRGQGELTAACCTIVQ